LETGILRLVAALGGDGKMIALRTESGGVVCARCRLATTALRRMRGLLGRRGLDEDEGLLLRPAPSIHTLFMRFAIDVVFLDGDDCVVKIVPALAPWRFAGARGAKAALELPAGRAEELGLRVGDRVVA
jgi:uncharacterized protein